MGANTKIQWCHHTWNPWRGCTKVSDGCRNCYAEKMSKRNLKVLGQWGPNGTRVVASESMWREPLKWNETAKAAGERHRVFCASLADVFEGEDTMPANCVPIVRAARLRLMETINSTPWLDWLLLTKRPENIMSVVHELSDDLDRTRPLDAGGTDHDRVEGMMHAWLNGRSPANVWLGVSVEDQKAADERIPHLLKVPAAVWFLSCEPLLGPVNLKLHSVLFGNKGGVGSINGEVVRFPGFDWVIAGGESGHGARPAHPDWFRSLRDQCQAAEVPFFFKQFGDYGTISSDMSTGAPVFRMFDDKRHWINKARTWVNGGTCVDRCGRVLKIGADFDSAAYPVAIVHRVGKKKAGRLLDGREWNEMPAQRAASRLAGNTDGDLDD